MPTRSTSDHLAPSPRPAPGLSIRATRAADGAALYQAVLASGGLEPNSGYAYVMLADMFGDTCALAELDGRPVGCLIALRPPRRPQGLFVWQIGVAPQAQRRGLAHRMLEHVLARPAQADVQELLATVAPTNRASEQMFRAFALRRGAHFERAGGYPAELFPRAHEAEVLYRIAPL